MFKDLYKETFNSAEQQKLRRIELLEHHKEKRLQLQDENRSLSNTLKSAKKEDSTGKCRQKSKRNFKDIYHIDVSLQLSEWLREKPEDLYDWILLPCPKGQRCLVAASNGRTAMYNKAGRKCFSFPSLLPGGVGCSGGFTLLDCIFVAKENAFYVLDALAFGTQDLLHCEAQFRFFWLRSKFEELEEIAEPSEHNNKIFRLVEHYNFEHTEEVSEALQRYPLWPDNKPELDGFLFYHKDASYTCGTTPLVCWLFAFMVKDVLDMSVSSCYEAPADYVEPLQYIECFDAQLAQKKHKDRDMRMDEDDVSNTGREPMSEEMDEASREESALLELLDHERRLELEQQQDDSCVDEKR